MSRVDFAVLIKFDVPAKSFRSTNEIFMINGSKRIRIDESFENPLMERCFWNVHESDISIMGPVNY